MFCLISSFNYSKTWPLWLYVMNIIHHKHMQNLSSGHYHLSLKLALSILDGKKNHGTSVKTWGESQRIRFLYNIQWKSNCVVSSYHETLGLLQIIYTVKLWHIWKIRNKNMLIPSYGMNSLRICSQYFQKVIKFFFFNYAFSELV